MAILPLFRPAVTSPASNVHRAVRSAIRQFASSPRVMMSRSAAISRSSASMSIMAVVQPVEADTVASDSAAGADVGPLLAPVQESVSPPDHVTRGASQLHGSGASL